MRTLFRAVAMLAAGILVSACGGAAGPDGGGPGPSGCRETISQDITTVTVLRNGPEACDYYFPGGPTANHNYRVTNDLTIEPGTVVRFGQNAMLYVLGGGQVTAVGSEEARIRLEGEESSDGYWFGVCFEDNRTSRLEYVDVRSAGRQWATLGTDCMGGISGKWPGGAPVHVKNTTVSGSYASGLSAYDLDLGEFENNAFFGNREFGAAVPAMQIHKLDADSDYRGADSGQRNGMPYIYAGGNISDPGEGHIWLNLNAPYYVRSPDHDYHREITVADGTFLVFEEGTKVVFDGPTGLFVSGDSGLGMAGTPENPVVLTGVSEEPGSWLGVTIVDSGAILQNVEIMWAGGLATLYRGSLYFADITDGWAKQLENVFIDGSAACALVIEHDDLGVFDPLDVTYGMNNEEDFCWR